MNKFYSIVIIGALTVLMLDTGGSMASQNFGFPYYWLSAVSLLIYAGIGFTSTIYDGLIWAPIAAGIVGLIDATIGWFISWQIGPGRPAAAPGSGEIILTIVMVIIMGALVGLAGVLAGLAVRRLKGQSAVI